MGKAAAEHVDVTHQAETVALAGRVVKRFKRIDVLFNNAGISGVGDVLETEPELFDRVMSVNVRGVYLMSRAVVPVMIKQRSGFDHQHVVLHRRDRTGAAHLIRGIKGRGAVHDKVHAG